MDTTGGGGGLPVHTAADYVPATTTNLQGTMVETTRKRPLERHEDEAEDREMDKMYKSNFWEDPAYTAKLRFSGLQIARVAAAYENLLERVERRIAERHARRQAAYAGRSPSAGSSSSL